MIKPTKLHRWYRADHRSGTLVNARLLGLAAIAIALMSVGAVMWVFGAGIPTIIIGSGVAAIFAALLFIAWGDANAVQYRSWNIDAADAAQDHVTING